MNMKWWLLFIILTIASLTGWAQWSSAGSTIYYNTSPGNVGIGTSTPGTTLEIMTTSIADGVQLRYSGAAGFVRLTGSSFAAGYLNPITASGDAGLIFGANTVDAITTGFVIAPYKSSLSGLRVDKSGNVGIYTNDTKGYQLAVNGAAIFTSAWVKPYANWPDYVFLPDYHLPPLDSLSSYIETNHHLPDIPSADSIQRNGFDLGGTQAALLKKIEELTLYVIGQKKEIEALKKKNDQLKLQQLRIDRLEKALEQIARKQPITNSNPRP